MASTEKLLPPAVHTGWPWMPTIPKAPVLKNWPRISIVTPSFNQAAYLEETIRSVLLQGYPNLQYILMDGGSNDGSVEIIKKYSPWLDHWQTEKDKGQADAIYRGFERSDGQIIAWLNSDDLYLPGALWNVGRFFMRHPRAELTVGGCLCIDPAGQLLFKNGSPDYILPSRQTFGKFYYGGQNCAQPAMFWKRDAFFDVGGFDRSLFFCFDADLFLRLVKRRAAPSINKPLACFRIHDTSKSTAHHNIAGKEGPLVWGRHGLSEPWPLGYRLRNAAYRRWGKLRVRWAGFKYRIGVLKLPRHVREASI